MKPLVLYLWIVNAFSLLIMLIDKHNAVEKSRRIPEASLMLCALAGGSSGIFLGMLLFRHKTRKPLFILGVPLILAIQILLVKLYGII